MKQVDSFTTESVRQPWHVRCVMMPLMMLSILLLTLTAQAQDPPQYGTPFNGVPHRMDANIYQMNLREYSSSRDIAGARAKLQRIKDLGINVIYLMPIYPLGVTNNPDGSPYSHQDLKSVASDLGSMSDLRGFVTDAHNLGMAVMLDWVANQTAWDHPWITQHPDWYVQDGNGNIVAPCPEPGFCFNDVAHLDLNNSSAAAAMVDAMRYWIFAANIDGYRFDWADKAPPAFWTNTISNLRSISSHDLLLLAEGSNEGASTGCIPWCGDNEPGYHYSQGFDYIFGTNFYWNVMKKIWSSGEPATNLDGVTTGEYVGASSSQMVARYLSNHDDYNADGSPFAFMNGKAAVMSAFAVIAYHRGVPFVYNGIEVGNTNPLPYPWNSGNINWTQDLSVYTEMQKILNFRNSSVALRRGQPTSYIDPANTNPNVIAFTKTSGSEKVAVMVNVRNGNSSFTIPSGMAGSYIDAYTGSNVTLTSGATQNLSAYQYLVLTNASVPVVDVTGVSVNPTSVSISEGLTTALSASIAPSNATNQNVSWSSSNTGVATVNGAGLVTAISQGTATITVTTDDGNHTASSIINVTAAPSFTVHFYRPSTWGTGINIYWWEVEPSGVLADGSWPGVAMTSEGGDWYSHTFTNITSTNLIFNDGTSQSANLSRASEGWYQNGTWYNSNPGVLNSLVLSTASQIFTSGASSQSVTVASNVSWMVSDNQSWISTSTASGSNNGSFTVSTTTNTGGARSGLVTVAGGGISRTISVSQSAVSAGVAIPGIIQAESWTAMSGVQTESTSDTGGGLNVGWINAGDWMDYNVNVANSGQYTVSFRMASGASGGTLELRNSAGATLGSATVGGTGGWQNWTTVTTTATLTAGSQTIRLYAASSDYNVNWVQFAEQASGGAAIYIKNRWTGTYLYDAGTNVSYSGFSSSADHQWELENVEGHTAFKNVSTGHYINIEALTGTAQSTNISTGAWSAQWIIEDFDGYKRLRNRWVSGDYIHIENLTGSAEHGGVDAGAWSSHWTLESTAGARINTSQFEEVIAQELQIQVYPNPMREVLKVSIQHDKDAPVQIEIRDITGRVMYFQEGTVSGTEIAEVDVSSYQPGLYIVRMNVAGRTETYKVIKE